MNNKYIQLNYILTVSSVAAAVDGATEDPSTIAASDALIPSSGSRSRHATLGSVLATAARLRLQGIQKQHFLSSVSSPVIGSTLFTERQQKIFLRQSPHLPCCFGRCIVADWCIGSTFDSSVTGFFLQLLQQLDIGQQRDFFLTFALELALVSSITSIWVVLVALLLALNRTGCSSTEPCRRSCRRPQQRMQWERRKRMHRVVQQRQMPPLPTSSLRNSWLLLLLDNWTIEMD